MAIYDDYGYKIVNVPMTYMCTTADTGDFPSSPEDLGYVYKRADESDDKRVECEHCEQWGDRQSTCEHCGGKINKGQKKIKTGKVRYELAKTGDLEDIAVPGWLSDVITEEKDELKKTGKNLLKRLIDRL